MANPTKASYPSSMLDRGRQLGSNVRIGIGFYTVPEAGRLLKIPARNIHRWLGGYAYKRRGETHQSAPLWAPDLANENGLELSFRDLIELRFVNGFIQAGLGLRTIRNCLDYAKVLVDDERPFSTQLFQTDGRTIFLDSVQDDGDSELLDLKKRQYAIKQVIEKTFKDLDFKDNSVARWRPFKGKESIVIDPQRAFGQPIAAAYGVPTIALADAVKAEGSINRVSRLYEIKPSVVRDAVHFEEALLAA
jgi:uncharacterized protein (DUF433 family)